MSRPLRSVVEDVHIHATFLDVCDLIASPLRWAPPAITEAEGDLDALAFRLLLPLRSEHARLARAADEAAHVLAFAANGDGGAVRGLTWVVNVEAPREVHLVAELLYEPAGGPIGWALEEVMHRPSRRQALRDALWRLKLLAEGRD